MKASDLATIQDPMTRLLQSHKYLKALEDSRAIAIYVRDHTILELRNRTKPMSYRKIAEQMGLSKTRIIQMEKEASKRVKSQPLPQFERWEGEHQNDSGQDN